MSNIAIVGIDLGTTTTECAYYDRDKGVISLKFNGSDRMRSAISFEGNSHYVGDEAFKKTKGCLITNTKRIIGLPFRSPIAQRELQQLNLTVTEDPDTSQCAIVYNGKDTITPTEVAQIILLEVRKCIEKTLGTNEIYCVITVPASFDDKQREATRQAVIDAGIKVIDVMNEPTAAALHCNKILNYENNDYIMVFDFGGGTFDVSIVKIDGGTIRAIATHGDNHLGGKDIDENIKQFVKNECKKLGFESELGKIKENELIRLCEQAKIELSSNDETTISFGDAEIKINRIILEEINGSIKERCKKCVEQTLQSARLTKENIKDVILVGGSSLVPFISKIANEYCVNNTLERKVNPQKVVSLGAAEYAFQRECGKLPIRDICTHFYGTSVIGKKFDPLVRMGAPLPAEGTATYKTVADNQTECKFDLLQSDHAICSEEECYKIGDFFIRGLPERKQGEVQFQVTCTVGTDGMVTLQSTIIQPKDFPSANKVHKIKTSTNEGQKIKYSDVGKKNKVASITELSENEKQKKIMYHNTLREIKKIKLELEKLRPKEYQSNYKLKIETVLKYGIDELDHIIQTLKYLQTELNNSANEGVVSITNDPPFVNIGNEPNIPFQQNH